MPRFSRVPPRSASNTAETDRLMPANAPDAPGSPRASVRRGASLAGAPPVGERRSAAVGLRGSMRAGQEPSARKHGGPHFQQAGTRALPGRAVPAGSTPSSIDTSLNEWIDADPLRAEARQKAAALIQHCHTAKNTHLDLSGLHVGRLPDCLNRIALTDLTLADCQLQMLPGLPPALTALNLRQNQLGCLPPLPAGLVKLDVTANRLQRLQGLPARLESLAAAGNQLTVLREVPQKLTFLDLSSNRLNRLPELPSRWRWHPSVSRRADPSRRGARSRRRRHPSASRAAS